MNGDEPTRSGPASPLPGDSGGFPTVTPAPPPVTQSSSLTAAYPPPPVPSTKPADIVPVRRKIGKYSIIKEIGRGGMGVVYLAHQDDLNRDVALKVISAGPDADQTEVARFNAEAETAANLHHPNIVPVYEVGTMDHLAFLAMELVDGGSLYKLISKQPLDPVMAATLLEPVARAIHYAHCQGVIHRDIKPSNILLENSESGIRSAELRTRAGGNGHSPPELPTPRRVLVPKIVDFGLAKRLHRPLALTQTGLAVGTPHYMAPEQALGRADMIGPATDIYALGAVLYEMLTGHPPFGAGSSLETMQQVVSRKPVPPSVLRPTIPPELERICLKCLEKKRENRYPTAQAVADALHDYVHGSQPATLAAPAAAPESSFSVIDRRVSAWRHWPAAAVVAVLLTILVSWRVTHRNWAREERQWAAKYEARDQDAHRLNLRNALLLADRGDFHALAEPGWEPAEEYRAVVAEYRKYDLEPAPWAKAPTARRAVFDPSGRFLLATTDTHFVAVRADTGEVAKADPLGETPADPAKAAFVIGRSRSSPLFAVVSAADPTKLSVGTAEPLPHIVRTVTLPAAAKLVQPLADGSAVLVSDGTGRWVVDAKKPNAAPQPVAAGPGDPKFIAVAAVSELGQWLVETADGWRVLTTAKETLPAIPSPGATAAVAFSPTGSHLVAVLRNGGVRLYDFADRRWADLPADGSATAAAFSPDGNILVVGTRAGTVRLWDIHARARLSGDASLNKKVVAVDIAADRKTVVAVTDDQAVHRFQFHAQPHYSPAMRLEPGPYRDIVDIAFSANGDSLYVTTPRGLSRWTVRTAVRQKFAGEPEVVPTEQMMLSDRKKRNTPEFRAMAVRGPTKEDATEQVLLGGVDGKMALLDLGGDAPKQSTQTEVPGGETVTGVAVSADGKTVAVCDTCAPGEAFVRFWKTPIGTDPTGDKTAVQFPFRITCEGFTPDNALVIFGCEDGFVRLWDPAAPKGQFVREFACDSRVICVAVNYRGDRVLAGCADGRAVVFDLQTGDKLRTLKHPTEVRRAAFHGDRPITAAADGAVRVWHPAHDFTVGPPFRHADAVTAISIKGNLLAAASRDRTIRVWNLPPKE